MHRPNHSFCQGRYNMLDYFCFAEFFSCYKLIFKPKEVDRNDYFQPDTLRDSLIEDNHNCSNYSKMIKLMSSKDALPQST